MFSSILVLTEVLKVWDAMVSVYEEIVRVLASVIKLIRS